MKIFEDYAYYYNLFYQEKNYAKESKIVYDLITMYKPNIKKVLNLGCGTGRHDLELSNLGLELKGIDFSSYMIKEAQDLKNKNPTSTFTCIPGDIRSYRDNEIYNATIALFHVMSYQIHNEDIIATFLTAYESLEKDGIFLFDVWYGPGVLTDKPETRVKKIQDKQNDIVRIASPTMDPNKNIVDIFYEIYIINRTQQTIKKISEKHKMRYYFEPEICFYLKQTGFKLLKCLDCNNLIEPNFNSWTVYFLAQKVR